MFIYDGQFNVIPSLSFKCFRKNLWKCLLYQGPSYQQLMNIWTAVGVVWILQVWCELTSLVFEVVQVFKGVIIRRVHLHIPILLLCEECNKTIKVWCATRQNPNLHLGGTTASDSLQNSVSKRESFMLSLNGMMSLQYYLYKFNLLPPADEKKKISIAVFVFQGHQELSRAIIH